MKLVQIYLNERGGVHAKVEHEGRSRTVKLQDSRYSGENEALDTSYWFMKGIQQVMKEFCFEELSEDEYKELAKTKLKGYSNWDYSDLYALVDDIHKRVDQSRRTNGV